MVSTITISRSEAEEAEARLAEADRYERIKQPHRQQPCWVYVPSSYDPTAGKTTHALDIGLTVANSKRGGWTRSELEIMASSEGRLGERHFPEYRPYEGMPNGSGNGAGKPTSKADVIGYFKQPPRRK